MPTDLRPATSPSATPSARTLPGLSEIEAQILEFMVLYLQRNTFQPSIREIGERFGLRSTRTVTEHLKALAGKGYIERDPSRSRGIRILGLDLNARTVALPHFATLAEAVAATVQEAHPETHLSLDARLVDRRSGFLVGAPGKRLEMAGIRAGDTLIVQPARSDDLTAGEIVVAQIGRITDYCQLRKVGPRLQVYPIGGGPGLPRGAAARQPVIVGRVTGLFRTMGAQPVRMPLTPH